jgi:thiosulfate/3-mercaptopyruvate sulfurtransferase
MEEATMTWPMLIRAEQAAGRLADPRLRIFDCRYELARPAAGREAWLRGHLPGAVHVDLHHDLAGPTTSRSGRHPLPASGDFAARLRSWGVDDDSLLLAYDDSSGLWAARFWWMTAIWLGHRHVALLDGGLRAWTGHGLPITTDVPSPRGTGNFAPRADASRIADADATAAAALQPQGRILDARAGERFRGEVEPIDPVAGHVPGALNLPASTVTGPDGHFLAPAALARLFADTLRGAKPAATIAMCGSGVTACQLLFAMEYAGLPGARLYPGSWSEWSRNPERDVEKGIGNKD